MRSGRFLLKPTKKFSSKIKEKTDEKNGTKFWTKKPLPYAMFKISNVFVVFFFSFTFSFSFFVFFCYQSVSILGLVRVLIFIIINLQYYMTNRYNIFYFIVGFLPIGDLRPLLGLMVEPSQARLSKSRFYVRSWEVGRIINCRIGSWIVRSYLFSDFKQNTY